MRSRLAIVGLIGLVAVVAAATYALNPSSTALTCTPESPHSQAKNVEGATGDSSEATSSALQESADALVPPPTGATANAMAITSTSATLHGSATPNGEDTLAYFQYGPSPEYGSKTAPTDVGRTKRAVPDQAQINQLRPATTYHYQQIIETPTHILYGADECFVTGRLPGTGPTSTPSPKLVPATQRP
jgi:hypothetical protein